MNEIMEKDQLEGKDPTLLRMKIVDPYEYQKNNTLKVNTFRRRNTTCVLNNNLFTGAPGYLW